MKTKPLYREIAIRFNAYQNCLERGNSEWMGRHFEDICEYVSDHLPHGGGFDNGTSFDFEFSDDDELVFNTSFHHMNDVGMYCGWTDHRVIVRPSLCFGFTIEVTGPNRNDIKDYIGELFNQALETEV